MHGGLICIVFCMSVCMSVRDLTEIHNREQVTRQKVMEGNRKCISATWPKFRLDKIIASLPFLSPLVYFAQETHGISVCPMVGKSKFGFKFHLAAFTKISGFDLEWTLTFCTSRTDNINDIGRWAHFNIELHFFSLPSPMHGGLTCIAFRSYVVTRPKVLENFSQRVLLKVQGWFKL